MTLSEVTGIAGVAGDFTVTVKEAPRYVDMDKCIACGACTEKCPKKVDSEYNAGTGKRKAIYVKYAQAVPLKYQIDPLNCIRLQKPGACGFCEKVCDAGAINFDDTEKIHQINVGAVVLAPGFEAYDPKDAQVWGYGTMPNVITAMQLERYLSASGPTEGHLVRPSDGKPVNKVAFLQCIGSRDENLCGNGYCSSVCCMYAIKEAVIAKDHVPGLSASIFYMDMRTHGKDFDKYLERAKDDSGVRFVRCRINGVEPQGTNGDLRLHYINERGRQVEEYYDMVVLSVGLQTPKHVLELAHTAGIQLTADKFAATSDFSPVQTSQAGIFTCGAFAGPKDIPQSVVEGSAAAAAVADLLAPARHQLSTEATFPTEKDVSGDDPRIGVFVCHCGSNIAGVVDVKAVEDYAATLPNVVYVERNLFSCSQDTQEQITKRIQEKDLNRIVIAACTPRTHEPLFRETLKAAGLNEYLVEMANIRNHNSWVHVADPAKATAKAKDLVRMAAAKVTFGTSLKPISVPITQKGLIIGGGVAGMTSALNLAEQGFEVHLVERTETLGGNALYLKHTWSGEHIPTQVAKLVDKVVWNDKITIHKGFEVSAVEGFVGNFKSTISSKDGVSKVIEHGIGIVATGANIFTPDEYGYGSIKRVVTSIEFDKLHELKEKTIKASHSFVFIQCVGSRETDHMYCSKVCCTHSVQSAIDLKQEDPSRNVYILYRDMRTYGQREALYRQARKMGVIFINYELHGKPLVSENGPQVDVEVWDHVLHRPLKIKADMVILAAAIRPKSDAADLGKLYKIPVDGDGFFQEAHAKLRPVDFSTDGMFVAGMAHYPKPMEESVAQALAASARAATLLSKFEVSLDAVKATVDPEYCDGCALCVDVCPYNAITLVTKEAAVEGGQAHKIIEVNKAQCKGCGLCQGTCPKRGVYIAGFTMKQISSQIQAALAV
ncbi:MAG: CoB--CoM heterodisulfide reductase iron-sulfur subunit A family protein [Desulfobulbaceae bacterium]|nr:MAG: CoB--CoM heterodisulfide reductase iron-sulfur subunit A family protein [Desulfobulbaceae bacterium]